MSSSLFLAMAFSWDCTLVMIWLFSSINSLVVSSDDDIFMSTLLENIDTNDVTIPTAARTVPMITCLVFLINEFCEVL